MGSPVTSNDFNILNYAGSLCEQVKHLLSIASNLKTWFGWAFDTDGAATTNFKALFSENNVPVGSILFWPLDAIPSGYLKVQGQSVSRTTYANLFAVLGTEYGAGDGSTTFTLPDMQGRMAFGASSTYAVKSTGGHATKTLGLSEIPSHTHGFNYTIPYGNTGSGGGAAEDSDIVYNGTYGGTTNAAGGGSSFSLLNPYLAGHWIIKT